MKTLAILDSASLDRAIGGVSRAAAPTNMPFNIAQLAQDFGIPIPGEVLSKIDAISSTVASYVGAATDGADAPVAPPSDWCGTPAHASTPGSGTDSGSSSSCSGDEDADVEAQEASDWCGTPTPTSDASDASDASSDASDSDVVVTEEPAAPPVAVDAAHSPGGVLVTSTPATTSLSQGGGWFDFVDGSDLATLAETSQSTDSAKAGGLAGVTGLGGFVGGGFEDLETVDTTQTSTSAGGFDGSIRDHRAQAQDERSTDGGFEGARDHRGDGSERSFGR